MVFGAMVLALFILQAQAVFAQNVSFRMFFENGGYVRTNGQNIMDRIQSIGGQIRDSSMVIIIEFKDSSYQTFAFIDIDGIDDTTGITKWSNVRMVDPNTGGFSPERFTGESLIRPIAGLTFLQFAIINNRGTPIFQVAGAIRFF
jgi:hypothetical protein